MVISNIETGEIIDANDSFFKVFGSSREEIIGKTSLEIGLWGHPDQRNPSKKMMSETGSFRDVENTFYTQSGEQRLGLCSAERMDVAGVPCMLSIVKDITEQREMEKELLRMDRLHLVGQMAAGLGHEIRNPMTAVRGFLQMFTDKYSEDREFLDLMIEELDGANEIITEFLSLAKNKAVELQPANLNTIVIKILPLIQANARLEEKTVRMEAGEIPDVMVDEKEIRQLILNLVKNGLEAMSSGGTVTLRTFIEEGWMVLSVQDQGCGVDPDLMDKLGIPFFTTKQQGVGLGLAVCYGIAARHHARIDLQTSSVGTTFYVRFPKMEA
jgi:PAS domain S-box-containing protein